MTSILSFVVAAAATLSGTVSVQDAKPGKVTVTVVLADGSKRHAELQGGGRFEFSGLETGVYEVRIKSGKRTFILPRVLVEPNGIHLPLAMPPSMKEEDRLAALDAAMASGRGQVRGGLWREAIESLTGALKYDSGHAAAWAEISLARVGLGELDEALAAANIAIALGPDEDSYFNNAGSILYRLGRYAEAAERHQAAAELNPDGRGVYLSNAAASYVALGRTSDAIRAYEAATSDPNCPASSWFHLGIARMKSGLTDGAISALQAYLAKEPDGPFAEIAKQRIEFLGGLGLP